MIKYFSWKKGTKNFIPTPIQSLLHLKKAFYNFFNSGQRSTVERNIGLQYAMILHSKIIGRKYLPSFFLSHTPPPTQEIFSDLCPLFKQGGQWTLQVNSFFIDSAIYLCIYMCIYNYLCIYKYLYVHK